MVQETNFCASCVPEAKGKPWWILIEESPKWLRVKVGDHFLANSKHALIVNEAGFQFTIFQSKIWIRVCFVSQKALCSQSIRDSQNFMILW